jgi:S-adenosylmethionine:tRNA ribosyltransferase-isomerase
MTGPRVADFDFDLPPELIAQQPPASRGESSMLVVDRSTGAFRDAQFAEFPSQLVPGDLLVLNDSRVIPARLYARRATKAISSVSAAPQMLDAPSLRFVSGARVGNHESRPVSAQQQPTGRIEVMLTEPVAPQSLGAPGLGSSQTGSRLWGESPDSGTGKTTDLNPPPTGENLWRALVRPGRKVAIGERLVFPAPSGAIALEAEVFERGEFGERLLRFNPVDDFFAVLDRIGHMPLPPYIHRDDAVVDRERYQTVFAREPGSVAAPTAGLHFTPRMLEALDARGIEVARITLHVGLGTFAPLRVDNLDEVRLHRERYTLSASTADAVNRARSEGRRIVGVGTTVVRTLEHCALHAAGGVLLPHSGETEIFIAPGFEFRLVGGLLTNFHLPQSSLLMLVSAFAGRERVLAAYSHAVRQKYRFFSYGDCMFLA